MHLLKEYGLEEGGCATARTVVHAIADHAREHWPLRTYAMAWCAVLATVWTRDAVAVGPLVPAPHQAAVVGPVPVPHPSTWAAVYAHMPSSPVRPDYNVTALVTTLYRTQRRHNLSCLAAVHVGVPLRVAVVEGRWTLVNPRVVALGHRPSHARETSAFAPHRPPCRVTRFVPVTVWNAVDETTTVVRDRATAHCVLHVLDQFEGRLPCDAPRTETKG